MVGREAANIHDGVNVLVVIGGGWEAPIGGVICSQILNVLQLRCVTATVNLIIGWV
jgi:hypothetical protein